MGIIMQTRYDYIIVGSGSAGSVLAGRLSANPARKVLLLEAGGANDSVLVRMPKGIAKLVTNPAYHWAYRINQARPGATTTTPETWIRGKGLGGSSAINGMIWSRGHAEDYDNWERMGCQGWNWPVMNEAFKALEDHQLGGAPNRGVHGPVTISPGTFRYPLTDAMLAAGQTLGLSEVADLNDSHGERVGFYSHNIRRGRRVSSARAFLDPVRQRSNLTIVTQANVQKIRFEGTRAVGVEALVAGRPAEFACAGEIIVAAGTLESPRLLQLSGIGPRAVLDAAGVPVVCHSPDVGQRMREHLSFAASYRLNNAEVGSHRCFSGLGLLKSIAQFQLFGTGALATGPFEVGAFARVGGATSPNLQLYLSGYNFALSDDNHPVTLAAVDSEPGMSVYGQLLQLKSEGSINIVSRDPQVAAEIKPNWLTDPEDQQLAIATVRYLRSFAEQPALRRYVAAELVPGAQCQSDADILDAFTRLSTSGLHGTGTCRMGGDADAVVDARLRVNGVSGLRVVDCSVMPGLISGNTNAPAMALAYRAADLILADRK
jgi:choline dehydrogenase-like flavoprotein